MSENLIKEYVAGINFEVIEIESLNAERIDSLEIKNGLVYETDTTDLWVLRELAIVDMLGIPTVMESSTNFIIMDSFGITIWSGDAASVAEYIKGWDSEEEIV